MPQNNKTYCPHPFKYLMVSPMGFIKPCCRFHPNDEEGDFQWDGLSNPHAIFSGPGFKQVQNKMISGQPVKACDTCDLEEKAGVQSMRQKVISRKELSLDPNPRLEGMEIGFSRVCNLACATCNGHFSTKWEKYEKALNRQPSHYKKLDFKWSEVSYDQLKDLRSLKITGGEPLLSEEFFLFVQRLVDDDLAGKIEIEVFTNCTIKPKLSLLRNLERFKRVEINLSLDATGAQNDYIRYHSSWEQIEKVAQVWRMASHGVRQFKIGFAITVSALNVYYLNDLYEWIYENFDQDNIESHNQLLAEPDELSIYKLDAETANHLLAGFEVRMSKFLQKWRAVFHRQYLIEEIILALSSLSASVIRSATF